MKDAHRGRSMTTGFQSPLDKGRGSHHILKTVVPAVFAGTAELRTLPSGASWNLEAPLDNVLAGPPPEHGVIGGILRADAPLTDGPLPLSAYSGHGSITAMSDFG